MAEGETDPGALAVVPLSALALGAEIVPMAGTWSVVSGDGDIDADIGAGAGGSGSGGVRFAPAFPIVPGVDYALLARSPVAGTRWSVRGRAVAPGPPPVRETRVIALDPDVAVVPENLLRFAVSFSAAMDEGGVGAHVHLRAGDGAPLQGALLPMPPELWDRPRRRLTVLLEPGRLKRGLRPHAEAGPPLRQGTTVTLVVDAQAMDAEGTPLVDGAERTYEVGPAVRSRVDPATWDVRWPEAEGELLFVDFGRPLDRVLVARCLRLLDSGGRPVAGHVSHWGSTGWAFSPAGPPTPDWALHVHPDLEDLAGNSVRRVFDRDLRESGEEPLATSGLILRPDGSLTIRSVEG